MTRKRQFDKQNGSGLILVVVVTVLLAVVGVMFLMVSRASEMETGAVIQNKDLGNAVDSVVAKINEVLVEDLFGRNEVIVDADRADEPYDYPEHNPAQVGITDDAWLGDLEPDWSSGSPQWRHLSDLYGVFFTATDRSLIADIASGVTNSLGPADADGDGVADSRWVQMPGLSTNRGEPVFAAVRIIDNCAMLNLNGAHCFYQDSYATGISPFMTPWYATEPDLTGGIPYHDNNEGTGRYLTEINYMPFLRGHDLNGNFFKSEGVGDDWYNIMMARGMYDFAADLPYSPRNCQTLFEQFEKPLSGYHFFDVGDELELRNRYILTSNTEARFERADIANFSLDSGGGVYSALTIPRDDSGNYPISDWYERIDPVNFDNWSGAVTGDEYKYDRRHVCTVYSYDRIFGGGNYPEVDRQFQLWIDPLVTSGQMTQQMALEIRKIFYSPAATSLGLFGFSSGQTMNSYYCRAQIVRTLFALRAYYLPDGYELLSFDDQQIEKRIAAIKAAQIVANLIDYSDENYEYDFTPLEAQGPFYGGDSPGSWLEYGQQAPGDPTYLTYEIINRMIQEVLFTEFGERHQRLLGAVFESGLTDFGLYPEDVVYGYERQPFISEIYAQWDEGTDPVDDNDDTLVSFAIEVINPYDDTINMEGWKLVIGSGATAREFTFDSTPTSDVLGADADGNPGHAVYQGSGSVSVVGGVFSTSIVIDPNSTLENLIKTSYFDPGSTVEIQLLRPAPVNSGEAFLVIDSVSDADVSSILNSDGAHSLQRDDDDWKFIAGEFEPSIQVVDPNTYQLGADNTVASDTFEGFQIAVPDDGQPLSRWHELETLGLYGNGPESDDPNLTYNVPSTLANLDTDSVPYFDLEKKSSDLLDYVSTIGRPDLGTLPGRININTAPVHVIAAAIPPTLADPNGSMGHSALDFARAIVTQREDKPFKSVSQLLDIGKDPNDIVDFQFYGNDPNNLYAAGSPSIENDIEERHWILSNLANKFTVRSDVFTAYILVRLGEDGPQRRMIGIFDRSQVWNKSDRPKLVALHPVPDPR